MSEIAAIRFCTRQLLKGNWKAWRLLLRKWWGGLSNRRCVRCGKKKPLLHPYCYSCQLFNLKKAILEEQP